MITGNSTYRVTIFPAAENIKAGYRTFCSPWVPGRISATETRGLFSCWMGTNERNEGIAPEASDDKTSSKVKDQGRQGVLKT
jgi:hypothetical protein